ncbi:hypothetical protein AALA90_17935 [Lachnospiraceae bacterium 38-10]
MSIERDEEETKDWDRFWSSGRVDDYLRYRGCFRDEEGSGVYRGKEDAGFFTGDGNCT